MKNLYHEPKSHQVLAYGIGVLPATLILIVYYVLKLIVKILNKFKVQLWKATLMGGVVFFLTAFFMPVVYSPYANAQVPHYGNTTEHDQIANYIVEVFGNDAPKAFQLLQECGENASLNPDAVNTAGNFPEGSRDIGVFMINEYWQKTQAKFLFNWKINVEIAHQLYVENGNSFKLWTGGRKCGI